MTRIEAIRTAATAEEVKGILLESGKVKDMSEMYEAVIGLAYGDRLVGVKKEEIASNMANQIMMMRENGSFRTLSVEEKYAEMEKLSELPKELSLCTMSELEEIAGMLGIEEDTHIDQSEYEKRREVEAQISDILKAKKLEALRRAGNTEEARAMLKECDTTILGEIGRTVDSEFSDRIAEAREAHKGDELIEWAIEWILERLELTEENQLSTETVSEDTTETESEEAAAIEFPLEGHTAESLKNLIFTIYARGTLMSKATGGDFYTSEALVEELKEYGTSIEEVLKILVSAGSEGSDCLRGLKFDEDKVVFTGFPTSDNALKFKANMLLATAIDKMCKEHKRILARKVDETNEKFSFRVWLVRLGLNGPEVKSERNSFYANLTGHTAFRTEQYAEKWYARRRELKATARVSEE